MTLETSRFTEEKGATEADRLAALARYNVLDTPEEPLFDDLVQIAADTFDAPIAVINFIADGRQWFKAEVGIGRRELPLDVSICRHAILQRDLFVVPDLQADERFANNPLIHVEGGLRFYAGALLTSDDGLPLGTVCVLDREPRPHGISERQARMLQSLARIVMVELGLRQRRGREEQARETVREAEAAARESEDRYRLAVRATNDAVWDWDLQTDHIRWNEAAQVLFGYPEEEVGPSGTWWKEHIHPHDRERVVGSINAAIAGSADRWSEEYRFRRADGEHAVVLDRGYVLRDDAGQAQRMIGAMLDLTDRLRGDRVLRESEERLRVAQAAGGIGTFELLPESGTIIVSEQFCRLWGVDRVSEVPVTFFLDLIHPEDRQRISTGRNVLPETSLDYTEYRIIRPDSGETRWMARKGEAIQDSSAGQRRYFGVSYDITDRKRAEEALRESEARLRESEIRFRQITELAPAITWFGNPDGTLSYLNPYWYQYTGQTPDIALPDGWAEVVHSEDLAALSEAWEHARATNTLYEVEARLRRKDGVYRWFLIRALPLFDDHGQVTGWLGNDADIEDRKAAERDLEEINATLEQRVAERTAERDRIWRNSNELMGIADQDGQWLSINPAWSRLLGWSDQDVLGRTSEWLEHPDDQPRTRQEVARLAAGETTVAFENRFRRRDGSYAWLSWTAVPESGRLYCTARDVTAEKERQAELEMAQEQLRQAQKMEAVGQLTGGIAHDFNNLLTVVTGNIDMVRRNAGDQLDARARRGLDSALKGAERAAALTQRLLAFSRRQPLQPRALNLGKVVTGMSDLLTRALGETVELETVTGAGLWPVDADPNQLESAILNLAVNARDAMPQGGKLTIEVSNAQLDASYASHNAEVAPGSYVMLAVTDTGHGMDRDTVVRVFEPFFTTKEVGKGTGLGLSMVYGFIKQSGGHVKLYSEPGHGTTVKIYLPRLAAREAEETETEDDTGLEQGTRAETILVVEDDDDVRVFTVESLRDLGYRVLEAHDGSSALRLLDRQEGSVDLLVTDVVMPGMSGREVADAARDNRPLMKVLFTTGYARNAAVHGGRLEPGVDLLSKPFTISALATKVRTVLERGASHRILVMDGDAAARTRTLDLLREAGFVGEEAANGRETLDKIKASGGRYDAVIMRVTDRATSPHDLTREIRALHLDLPLLIGTGDRLEELRDLFAADACTLVMQLPFEVVTLRAGLRRVGSRCEESGA